MSARSEGGGRRSRRTALVGLVAVGVVLAIAWRLAGAGRAWRISEIEASSGIALDLSGSESGFETVGWVEDCSGDGVPDLLVHWSEPVGVQWRILVRKRKIRRDWEQSHVLVIDAIRGKALHEDRLPRDATLQTRPDRRALLRPFVAREGYLEPFRGWPLPVVDPASGLQKGMRLRINGVDQYVTLPSATAEWKLIDPATGATLWQTDAAWLESLEVSTAGRVYFSGWNDNTWRLLRPHGAGDRDLTWVLRSGSAGAPGGRPKGLFALHEDPDGELGAWILWSADDEYVLVSVSLSQDGRSFVRSCQPIPTSRLHDEIFPALREGACVVHTEEGVLLILAQVEMQPPHRVQLTTVPYEEPLNLEQFPSPFLTGISVGVSSTDKLMHVDGVSTPDLDGDGHQDVLLSLRPLLQTEPSRVLWLALSGRTGRRIPLPVGEEDAR